MNTSAKNNTFGGAWKIGAIVVLCGYTLSTVLAFDGNQVTSHSKNTSPSTPSLQKELETDVALSAQKVWTSILDFMQGGLENTNNSAQTPNKESTSKPNKPDLPLLQPLLPQSESQILPAFSDIANDENKASIEILASIGLVKSGEQGKFFPHNHVRCSDFIRVVIDLHRYLHGYPLEGHHGLTNTSLLSLNYSDPLLIKKLNTAQELGILNNIGSIQRDTPITPTQAKQIINNTLNLTPTIGQKDKVNLINPGASVLTKSEMARYLVAIFQLEKSIVPNVFNDISNHTYHSAIAKLAQLGVVAGKNGNFYPDNYVLRGDGIIMIANSLLAQQGKALIINDFIHIDNIHDTTYFAAYAPHLEYLLTNEIGDFLLHPQQSGYLFLPTAQLTKGEAYTLISQAARVKLLNVDPGESAKPITRGELANLIFEVFDFTPKEDSPTLVPKQLPTTTTPNLYAQRREEKKGILVSFFKDMLDTL